MTQPVFSDCLTAKLHLAGTIQPHGALLVVNDHHQILGVSANSDQWLNLPPQDIIGCAWQQFFPDMPLTESLKQLAQLGVGGIHLRPSQLASRPVMLAGHRSADLCIIELESRDPLDNGPLINELARSRSALLSTFTAELGELHTVPSVAESLMRYIALATDFDRVMVLQFMPDWHGKVTAEVLKPGVNSYLHQHFPANDIPQNARTLYTVKRQRLIADAYAEPVAIIKADSQTLDLTWSELRAVHPAHIQYMKNMGVAASFSVSVVVDGALWGLVVCHSLTARTLPFSSRQLCEHMANTAALQISSLQRLSRANARHQHTLCRTRLKQALQTQGLSTHAIQGQLEQVRRAFQADGACVHYNGQTLQSGDLPPENDLATLRQWLQARSTAPVSGYSEIPAELANIDTLMRHASGALYVHIAEENYLMLLRNEQPENIEWAGPHDKAATGIQQKALSPRNSFQAWKELTSGQALPWADYEHEAAHELRLVLRELLDYLSLEQQSLTDPLTGLGNRQHLQTYLEKIRTVDNDTDTFTAILLVDLDHFKPINDTFGHAAGDQVLIEVGQRMNRLLRDSDLLARVGGDEFAIALARQKNLLDLQSLGERLIHAIEQPYQLPQGTAHLGASIGAAVVRPTMSLETALHNADTAMYSVKRSGRNGFSLFKY